jgi:anti-sigma factor (TIGR02949 family)
MTEHNHKTLSCDQLLGMLTDYLDGQAREELCHEIEAHIAGCNNCRVVVDTTRKTISLVHACNDTPINLPVDVRERLFQKLDLSDHIHPGQ